MPFGANNNFEILTDSRSIASAQVIHLSPEKDIEGVVASKSVDRHNARHPGSIYHPLMVVVTVDTADVDAVVLSMDHGDGAAFDWEIDSTLLSGQKYIFDFEITHPGFLIFPKGNRAAPDSLKVTFLAEAATIASTTFTYEILP